MTTRLALKIRGWWNVVGRDLFPNTIPKELKKEFEEFTEIRTIGRIQFGAWICFLIALYSFLSSFHTVGIPLEDRVPPPKPIEFIITAIACQIVGLFYLSIALRIQKNKSLILKSHGRRAIVIMEMAFISFMYLLLYSVLIYQISGNAVAYLFYIFSVSWMFMMSPRQRLFFFLISVLTMLWGILTNETETDLAHTFNIWLVLCFTLVAVFYNTFDSRQQAIIFMKQIQIQEEQQRITKLEEFKSRFYTNLTHEFRTPLTMIIGMSKEIIVDPIRWGREGGEVIRHHAGSLLQLVNQILDLSKITSGSLVLHPEYGNIVSYVGFIIDFFNGPASAKGVTLHYLYQDEEILMDYDPDKFKIILSNLISNAIKFSPEGKHIYISLNLLREEDQEQVEIIVRDQGIGIPQEELVHIFERFYQVKNDHSISGMGTGVGLALVRELVELFKGTISVVSTPGKGTQFTLRLPIHHTTQNINNVEGNLTVDREEKENPVPSIELSQNQNGEEKYHSILVIEDNADVSNFLNICLRDLYQLSFCKNGEDGISQAIHQVPELVICDIMMPVKDGFSVAREMKNNPVTSHIPVILLTAKADLASRIEGLETGADAYMTKPFEKAELRALIHNLLRRYAEFQQRYANPEAPFPAAENASHELEDEFITRVRNLIHRHLDDNEFSVHDLEKGLFLSRSQLHKKLKALTGLSAMQFVSRIRLTVAREKLRTESSSVSDIAYQVGYSDPNYFTRAYSEEFGETPTATRNRYRTNIL